MRVIEGRTDIIRDKVTNAILYVDNKEVKSRNRISKMETEIDSMKEELSTIKTLLERLIDGR